MRIVSTALGITEYFTFLQLLMRDIALAFEVFVGLECHMDETLVLLPSTLTA